MVTILNNLLKSKNFLSFQKNIFNYLPLILNSQDIFFLTIGTNQHKIIKKDLSSILIKNIDILKFEKIFSNKEFLKITAKQAFTCNLWDEEAELLLIPIITNRILKHIIILICCNVNEELISFVCRLLESINERLYLKESFSKKDLFFNEIFKQISPAIIVRDSNYNILFSNREIKDFYKCYEIEFKKEEPCFFCPLKQKTITQQINEKYYKIEQIEIDKKITCIIEDITSIIKLKNELSKAEKMSFLGKISSEITHEIKNPLNVIQLKLTLLENLLNKEGILTNKISDITKSIKEEIFRLSNMANDFLQFGKNIIINKVEFSLKNLINEILEDFTIVARGKGIKISFTYDEGKEYIIYADNTKIKQALINLLKNSIEELSLKDKDGKIDINLKKDRNYYLIEVIDNGDGIKDISNLFNPFYTTKKNGTGLGLLITKQNIEAHKGSIEYLRKNQKTIFRLTLPNN